MDPSRDVYLRRQVLSQPALALTSSLSSGQSFYTLESLEGATSLPFLKAAPPAPLRRESFPSSSERDAILRLDAQTRALQAEKEALDARARLLEAERGALLRNLPTGATALPNQRMYGGGLEGVDAQSRIQLEGPNMRGRSLTDNGRVLSHGLDARSGAPLPDIRSLSHGLDGLPGDPLQLGSSRVAPVVGLPSGAAEHARLSEFLRPRESVAGLPPGAAEHARLSEFLRPRESVAGLPFLPSANPMLARRDVNGARDPTAVYTGLAEANKVNQVEQSKALPYSKPLPQSAMPKMKPPPEQSEGWCAVCKLDCHNVKVLSIHIRGKKHKALVEQQQGNAVQREAAVIKQGINALPTTASQAGKKRGYDGKLEGSESAKRFKESTPASTVVVAKTAQAKATGSVEANPTAQKAPPNLVCKVCNIFTTGTANLASHMKGKRHAARLKELENSGVVVPGS